MKSIKELRKIPIHDILNIQNTGRRITMLCPFHSERTPSCIIYPDGGYKCFGCGRHGRNPIDFLMHTGLTFSEAINELREYYK